MSMVGVVQPLGCSAAQLEAPTQVQWKWPWHPATRDLAAGMIAGVANACSGFPMDTVKVRLQASSKGTYSGMGDCFKQIYRQQGLRGLYRGLSSPLCGVAMENGVSFLVFSRVMEYFRPGVAPHHGGNGSQETQTPLHAVPIAGAMAGMVLPLILCPTELVKCRMQMAQHASPLACLRHIIQSEGLPGLWRGYLPTLCRELPGNAIFFTTYEGLRRVLPGRGGAAGAAATATAREEGAGAGDEGDGSSSSSVLAGVLRVAVDAGGAILCGAAAGVVMWSAVLPLDVAKTRIQTAQPGSSMDTAVFRQLQLLWREGGRRRLWAGYSPTVARAVPANACQWLAWEFAMRNLPQAEEA